jgi:hypothetical protein
MRVRLKTFLSLACLLFLCGCLEFEEQNMAYRYDTKTDTLYIFQEYRGIHGTDKKEGLSPDELEKLDAMVNKEQVYFFSDLFAEYNRDQVLEWQKEAADSANRKDLEAEVGGEAAYKSFTHLIELILANVQVKNGPFYFDAKKRLCGVKKVTVTKASEIIRSVNEVLRFSLKEPLDENAPDEAKRVRAKAAKNRKEFIRLTGNRLEFFWPMTKADYEEDFGAKSKSYRVVESFLNYGGKIEFRDDLVHFSLGNPKETMTRLEMPVMNFGSGGAYTPNAVDAARKHTVILESFDVEAARKEFLKQN